MFRPQFAYPLPPAPCQDQTCQYSFDATNLPALSGTLAAGERTGRIPLEMDKDAPFYLRAMDTQGSISFRLEDPNRNAISDSENPTESSNYEIPSEFSKVNGATPAVLESGAGGLFAPAGGTFVLYLYNNTAGALNLNTLCFNLVGVKRYISSGCAG
jgi:hypothetical protein